MAAVGGIAGCSGSDSAPSGEEQPGARETRESTETPEPTPTPVPLRFPEYSFEESEGQTAVILTTKNPAEETRNGTMVVTVKGSDGEKHTASTDISLAPGQTETYRLTVDIEWSWFADNKNLLGVEVTS